MKVLLDIYKNSNILVVIELNMCTTRNPINFEARRVPGEAAHLVAAGQDAAARADEDAEAGLLEDVDVVVVGVPHRPAAGVPPRLLAARGEDVAAVAVRPLGPRREAPGDLNTTLLRLTRAANEG